MKLPRLSVLHSSEVKLCLIHLAPDLFVEGSCSVFGALCCARIPGLGLYKLSHKLDAQLEMPGLGLEERDGQTVSVVDQTLRDCNINTHEEKQSSLLSCP